MRFTNSGNSLVLHPPPQIYRNSHSLHGFSLDINVAFSAIKDFLKMSLIDDVRMFAIGDSSPISGQNYTSPFDALENTPNMQLSIITSLLIVSTKVMRS